MSITLYTYGTGDFSLHGYYNLGASTSANFTQAVANMQADSWSNDSYALMQAGHYTYAAWAGIGHLGKKAGTNHLQKTSAGTGHLRLDAGELIGGARCIALGDMCEVSGGDVGTSVSSIKVTFSSTISNVASVPGYTTQFYFKTTATPTPADNWGWFTGSPTKSLNWSTNISNYDITFTGITGFTLDNWFWCIYRLSSYDFPSYNSNGATPVSTYYTKDVVVSCGLSNTYVINP